MTNSTRPRIRNKILIYVNVWVCTCECKNLFALFCFYKNCVNLSLEGLLFPDYDKLLCFVLPPPPSLIMHISWILSECLFIQGRRRKDWFPQWLFFLSFLFSCIVECNNEQARRTNKWMNELLWWGRGDEVGNHKGIYDFVVTIKRKNCR